MSRQIEVSATGCKSQLLKVECANDGRHDRRNVQNIICASLKGEKQFAFLDKRDTHLKHFFYFPICVNQMRNRPFDQASMPIIS